MKVRERDSGFMMYHLNDQKGERTIVTKRAVERGNTKSGYDLLSHVRERKPTENEGI